MFSRGGGGGGNLEDLLLEDYTTLLVDYAHGGKLQRA